MKILDSLSFLCINLADYPFHTSKFINLFNKFDMCQAGTALGIGDIAVNNMATVLVLGDIAFLGEGTNKIISTGDEAT